VAHSSGREVRREGPVDAVAQADQDARGEPGLRLGQDDGEGVARAAAQPLQRSRQALVRPLDVAHRVDLERAPRTDPFEVATVVGVRARPGPSLDLDPVPGFHQRIAGQGGGQQHAHGPFGVVEGDLEHADLVAVARGAHGQDASLPRPIVGDLGGR
jgi:hypothetical protein